MCGHMNSDCETECLHLFSIHLKLLVGLNDWIVLTAWLMEVRLMVSRTWVELESGTSSRSPVKLALSLLIIRTERENKHYHVSFQDILRKYYTLALFMRNPIFLHRANNQDNSQESLHATMLHSVNSSVLCVLWTVREIPGLCGLLNSFQIN